MEAWGEFACWFVSEFTCWFVSEFACWFVSEFACWFVSECWAWWDAIAEIQAALRPAPLPPLTLMCLTRGETR